MITTSTDRALKAFLCHGSEDKESVRELYHRLRLDGVDPWLDTEKLLPGQEWDYEIKQAVRKSDVIIVCLSKKSTTKEGYVQREIKIALDLADEKLQGTIFIVPIKLEDCQVPHRLGNYQYINYFEDNSYNILIRSLRERARNFNVETLPGDGTLFNFNNSIKSVMGKRLYTLIDVKNLLSFYKDGLLAPDDMERLNSSTAIAISGEAMAYIENNFPVLHKRTEEMELLLSLIGITEPYEMWLEPVLNNTCYTNADSIVYKTKKIKVSSSNLSAIGYDSHNQVLEVDFHNGSTYRYFNVPEYMYDNLMSASSHGQYFNRNIRTSYRYQQI